MHPADCVSRKTLEINGTIPKEKHRSYVSEAKGVSPHPLHLAKMKGERGRGEGFRSKQGEGFPGPRTSGCRPGDSGHSYIDVTRLIRLLLWTELAFSGWSGGGRRGKA